jgi:hypothetical protein
MKYWENPRIMRKGGDCGEKEEGRKKSGEIS